MSCLRRSDGTIQARLVQPEAHAILTAVNITVAVGLITAGSTLAGGLIASITSLKIQGKQLREQNVLLKAGN